LGFALKKNGCLFFFEETLKGMQPKGARFDCEETKGISKKNKTRDKIKSPAKQDILLKKGGDLWRFFFTLEF